MSGLRSIACDCGFETVGTVEETIEAYRSRQFVTENAALVHSVAEVIGDHVIENNGDNVYDWPESEAVVVIQHWPKLAALIELQRSGSS